MQFISFYPELEYKNLINEDVVIDCLMRCLS